MIVDRDFPPTGYRPMPHDFAETFIRVGWDSIEAEVRAHKTTITRWITAYDLEAIADERPTLNQLRREHLERVYAAQGKRVGGRRPGMSRAARYVLGLRFQKTPAPSFFDAALMEEVK